MTNKGFLRQIPVLITADYVHMFIHIFKIIIIIFTFLTKEQCLATVYWFHCNYVLKPREVGNGLLWGLIQPKRLFCLQKNETNEIVLPAWNVFLLKSNSQQDFALWIWGNDKAVMDVHHSFVSTSPGPQTLTTDRLTSQLPMSHTHTHAHTYPNTNTLRSGDIQV